MSTTENNLPAAESDEAIGSALSIDQPATDTGPIVPDEYDGAPASEQPVPEANPRPGGKKLRLDLGDGTVYTGDTDRDLLEQVANGKRQADKMIRDLKAREQAAPASPAPQAQQFQPRMSVDNSDLPAKWDVDEYWRIAAADPLKAERYKNRELYGADFDPVQALRHSHNTSNEIRQQMTVAEFQRRNPDYIASAETSQELLGVLRDNRLAADSIVNLEWAFREAQRTGRIKSPVTNADGEVEYEDISFDKPAPARTATAAKAPPARRGATAPPSAGGGSGGEGQPAPFDPYSVPLDELRASINSGGKSLRR